MEKDWTLREELYKAFHQWPSLIVFFAAGCILGWLSSFVWPSYYRATTQIYIGLNPYRAYSDSIFLALASPRYGNLDDYKNWQMSQLESVIYLDDFMEVTLEELRREDPYWNDISSDELREILIAEWRNTGTWKLNAEHPIELHATQAASAWSQVTIDKVQTAVDAARKTFMIDQEMQEIITERIQSEGRVQMLNSTRQSLDDWMIIVQDKDPEPPLSYDERERVFALVANIAQLTPAWTNILNNFPPENAPLDAYTRWVERAIATIDSELPMLAEQIMLLEENEAIKQGEYDLAASASLGISPNINIEGLSDLPAQKIRASSQSMLIGGIIGFFTWIFAQIIRVARKDYDQ